MAAPPERHIYPRLLNYSSVVVVVVGALLIRLHHQGKWKLNKKTLIIYIYTFNWNQYK